MGLSVWLEFDVVWLPKVSKPLEHFWIGLHDGLWMALYVVDSGSKVEGRYGWKSQEVGSQPSDNINLLFGRFLVVRQRFWELSDDVEGMSSRAVQDLVWLGEGDTFERLECVGADCCYFSSSVKLKLHLLGAYENFCRPSWFSCCRDCVQVC